MKNTFLVSLLFCLVGCHSYETRTYDVTVRNNSAGPITIWLTKDGAPFEDGWLAPEDIALQSPKAPAKIISGVVVPAGKTAETGPRKGQFEPQTNAVLRVYGGQLSFDQLLASSRESKNRVDVLLPPGRSGFVVTGASTAVQVNQIEGPAPADQPSDRK